MLGIKSYDISISKDTNWKFIKDANQNEYRAGIGGFGSNVIQLFSITECWQRIAKE